MGRGVEAQQVGVFGSGGAGGSTIASNASALSREER
jgi:nitrogenase subunit NifH